LRKLIVSFVALGALALVPAAAQASSCPGEPPSSQVFSAYDGDPDLYFLAPGGDFDSAATWNLSHGAAVVPYAGDSVLALPYGASAVSPPICVGQGYPHGRMYGAGLGFLPSKVAVEVIYNGDEGVESDRLKLRGGSLAPTSRFALDESAFGLDPVTGNASIRLVFTAKSLVPALIDDVYIDPSARN
jgi:hypothetical protein